MQPRGKKAAERGSATRQLAKTPLPITSCAHRYFLVLLRMASENEGAKVHLLENVSGRLSRFFAAPIFFILLGCVFLFVAGRLIDETHPSFVFLLAILGVSIVLYGTGTQASGEGELKSVPIKVIIAGGAGVLAAVFGFGVVSQVEGIQKVFSKVAYFGVIELKPESSFDLNTLHITSTTREGRPLPVMIKTDLVAVFVPTTIGATRGRICVYVTNAENKPLTAPNPCFEVTWKTSTEHDYGEPITRIAEGNLPLVAPRNQQIPVAAQ